MNSPLVADCSPTCWSAAARDGIFRGGVDPVQLYISIAGSAYFYLSNNHTLSAIFGRDLMAPKATQRAPVAHDAT